MESALRHLQQRQARDVARPPCTARAPDGLSGDEGAFVPCSFWLVQDLAMVGDLQEAERLFRNLLRRGNHLGLFAEEIDPATGEQLGNFPQGLSHAALINTAYVLERLRPRAD